MKNKKLAVIGVLASFLLGNERSLLHAETDPKTAAVTSTEAAQPLTLTDCYNFARQVSETLKMKKEEIVQAEARRKQALGTALPNISWLSGTTYQDTHKLGALVASGAPANSIRREKTENEFNLQQNLFSGFRDRAAIKGAAADRNRLSLEYRRTEVTLLESVATGFYQIIFNEIDLKDIQSIIDETEARIKEMRDFVRIGRSRESEILTAESQLAGLRAQAAGVRGTIVINREALGYLINRDIPTTPLIDQMDLPILPQETEALQKAEDRSDLKALQEQLEVNKYLVTIARADYWPNLNFSGNYYTHRVGFQTNIDWDILFAINVPITKGGTTQGKVDEAVSQWRETRFELDQLERSVKSDIRTALAALVSTREQTVLLEDAYKKSQKSYETQVKEYRRGLVNNLDVLAASNAMLSAKESWDRAVVQSKIEYVHLNAVLENFPELNRP